jgi:putative FmdB family regulatory protein
MPIYEYNCGKCGDFEIMQKISDKPLTTCPTCRRKVTKLISSTTFHLKGSGWYITDYARKGESGGAKGEKKTEKADKSEAASASSDTSGSDGSSSTTSEKTAKSPDKKGGKKADKAAVA